VLDTRHARVGAGGHAYDAGAEVGLEALSLVVLRRAE
jgi:hypothetical protein